MIRPDFRKALLGQRGAMLFLWGFFVFSIFLYLVIAQFILSNPRFAGGITSSAVVRSIFWILVLVDLGYLVWWKKRQLARPAILDGSAKTKMLRALEGHRTPLEERAATGVSTYVTRKVVAFAIIEAIAVYGLVLAIVGRFLVDQYLLSALSLVLLFIEFPAKNHLEGLVQEVECGGTSYQGVHK